MWQHPPQNTSFPSLYRRILHKKKKIYNKIFHLKKTMLFLTNLEKKLKNKKYTELASFCVKLTQEPNHRTNLFAKTSVNQHSKNKIKSL